MAVPADVLAAAMKSLHEPRKPVFRIFETLGPGLPGPIYKRRSELIIQTRAIWNDLAACCWILQHLIVLCISFSCLSPPPCCYKFSACSVPLFAFFEMSRLPPLYTLSSPVFLFTFLHHLAIRWVMVCCAAVCTLFVTLKHLAKTYPILQHLAFMDTTSHSVTNIILFVCTPRRLFSLNLQKVPSNF